MDFKCVVVLYNTNYKQSISYMDLIQTDCYKRNEMEIICIDNSEKNFDNSELMLKLNHFYINMNGNQGLSKAYNAAAEYLARAEARGESLVVLLDDDTHIDDNYFEQIKKASQLNYDIYLPVVLDEEGILSPSIMKKYRCRRCKRLEQINEKNICGINSGMAIKDSIFTNYRYNEEIFLDYVDHSFIRDMKGLNKKILVVDTVLRQNFSSISDSYEQTLKRFKIFKKDIKIFYSRTYIDKIVFLYIIFRRKVGIFLQFKKPSVFWRC